VLVFGLEIKVARPWSWKKSLLHHCLYYNKLFRRSISKQRYSQLAGSITENVAKLSIASERMQAAGSSNDLNRRRGVAMSITFSISAVQTHLPDMDADEMSNSRRTPL